jgi:hypothetical protein
MSTAHVEIWLRNSECNRLTDCWRTDLVIQACTGRYLVDSYPEIIAQLQKKYGKPASARCVSVFPLATAQGGKTLSLTVGSNPTETLTFTNPATTLAEIYTQMESFFQKCYVSLENGLLTVTSKEHGPTAVLTIGGDSDLAWGPVIQGAGWTIKKHFYQNAWRIMLYPGGGETLNHIELEIPPCAYKLWTRVCHGANEETSVALHKFKGSTCHTVNLILPTIKTCAAHIVHPLMDKIVHNQLLADDDARAIAFHGVALGAGIGKQKLIEQLDYRRIEAQEKGDTELEARVQAVWNLAQLLPEC